MKQQKSFSTENVWKNSIKCKIAQTGMMDPLAEDVHVMKKKEGE